MQPTRAAFSIPNNKHPSMSHATVNLCKLSRGKTARWARKGLGVAKARAGGKTCPRAWAHPAYTPKRQ